MYKILFNSVIKKKIGLFQFSKPAILSPTNKDNSDPSVLTLVGLTSFSLVYDISWTLSK